ncbi:MAG TPA: maleylpyruvate isomerase family mycothiol-dependent enzyme [Rugosimonospora sp.]
MEHLDRLAVECSAFGQILESGDLDAAVPGCPGWSLAELAAHLGGIHRWARAAVTEGRPGNSRTHAPLGRQQLVAWFADGAAQLQQTLRDAGPDAPCWTMSPPSAARYWMRRQAHETAMHRWDAQASQGIAGPLDPVLAGDGVAEVVEMFFPRQVRLGRQQPLPHSLRIEIADGTAHVLAGDGLGPDAARQPCEATVSGPAEALLLLLWKRITIDDPRLTLTGARAAALQVLSANLTP